MLLNKTSYPASSQQQGIWFDLLTKSSTRWSFSSVKCFKGTLKINIFLQAVGLLVKKHSALRTNFEIDNKGLRQVISDEINIDSCVKIIQIPQGSYVDFPTLITSEVNDLHFKGYDLATDTLFNILVIQHNDSLVININIHHIIVDTMSMSIFWRDLSIFYDKIQKNDPHSLNDNITQYWQYAAQQEGYFTSTKYHDYVNYWSDKLSEPVPAFNNPFKNDSSIPTLAISEITIPPEVVDAVKSFCLRHKLVFSSVFLFAYALLLSKYSGLRNFNITNVLHGRGIGKKEYRDVIGLFANRIINKIALMPQQLIINQLQQVSQDLIYGFNNSDFPYEQLIRDLKEQNPKADTYSNVSFNLIKSLGNTAKFNELAEAETNFWGDQKIRFPRGDYDISLYVIDNIRTINLRFEVKCDSKWGPVVGIIAESFIKILSECTAKAHSKIEAIDFFTAEERQVIYKANNTSVSLNNNDTILDLWNASLKKNGSSDALIYKKHIFNYTQIDELSNKIAAYLIKINTQPEEIIGVLIARNQYLIAALIGILKAGAAYLPLDREFPEDRLNYIISEAGTRVILTDSIHAVHFEGVLSIKLPDVITNTSVYVQTPRVAADQLAYVIFTSGSTGRPKGVMINHLSVVNFITGMRNILNFEAKRLYSLTTVSFDIFLLEFLVTLCNGGTLVIGNEHEQRDNEAAVKRMIDEKINIFQCTPSRLKLILNELPNFEITSLTDILIGGEVFDKMLASALLSGFKGNVYNMYGPTETTVWSCCKKLARDEDVSIGQPISNTGIHILNDSLIEQAVGAFGEIYISGLGLARGYLNKPELTAERFIRVVSFNNTLMYSTGDVGRWLLNGDIETKGRTDQQIKIRGYRVELSEIEYCLKEHQLVKDAVIVPDVDLGSIYAFIISDEFIKPEILKDFLGKKLPAYMIPSAFFHVEELPKTLNEKIDHKALLSKIKHNLVTESTSLMFSSELVDEWRLILKASEIYDVDLKENFFDAGGHSLSALKLLDNIYRNFGVKIPLRDFFENPTMFFLNEKLKSSIN